ncbi:symplekin [Caerostris extrusa]|uniref:Symplekin n=1 Tax=Caerostris extrusa TaxID=172846 RepID=A0AAV4XJ01_CAEEX|nr:symplekin [Caerostris extrusa]
MLKESVCCDPQMTESGFQLAEQMITRRPTQQLLFLGILTDLTLHENVEIRSKAANLVVEIHKTLKLDYAVEAFALKCLKFLLKASPSHSDFVYFSQPDLVWSEELVKLCLHLYLSLLPLNHQLIHDLGTVYVETSADIKRTILRALEAPVKGMSMASPELLLFVEKCPKGAETLVTRIIHILTDKHHLQLNLLTVFEIYTENEYLMFSKQYFTTPYCKRSLETKKIWEGFIKCCQRTKSGSSEILLQLPAPQLKEVLDSCPDIREPLCKYVDTLTDHQKAHIPEDITILLKDELKCLKLLPLSKIDDSKDENGFYSRLS